MDEREAAFKALQYNVSALEAYQTLQQIYGNLITYCRNVVISGGKTPILHGNLLNVPSIFSAALRVVLNGLKSNL